MMQSLFHLGISFNASKAYPLVYKIFMDKMIGKRDWTYWKAFIILKPMML